MFKLKFSRSIPAQPTAVSIHSDFSDYFRHCIPACSCYVFNYVNIYFSSIFIRSSLSVCVLFVLVEVSSGEICRVRRRKRRLCIYLYTIPREFMIHFKFVINLGSKLDVKYG